ncbi:MAG: aldo/keto reductase [Oscillospiraceae bacterium]|nr:aldo/keto reductase [Oscillospiraceae bacterium]
MQYRKFGKTGRMISALGFGCMRLPEIEKDGQKRVDEDIVIPMLQKAFENGVNYFDTAYGYCNEQSQPALGKALKSVRGAVMFATKQPLHLVKKTEDFRKVLEKQLASMDTSYIDFYHFHGINKEAMDGQIKPMKLMKEAQKAIDEGLIGHMAFSFHGDPKDMRYIIEQGEIFSSVLLQYNLLDRSNEEAIAYLAESGIGVVAMGPVAGGRLAAPSSLADKLLGDKNPETAELAIRFVLGNPSVSCALSGMGSMAMLEQNLKVGNMEAPMNARDFEKAGQLMIDLKKFSDLYCTGCDYCKPCPQGINIPHIFNAFTHHNVYGMTALGKKMYRQVTEGHKDWHGNLISETVSKCAECGNCEAKCPQNIKIAEKLKEIDAIFAGL